MTEGEQKLDAAVAYANEVLARNDEWYLRHTAERLGISWEDALQRLDKNGFRLVDGQTTRKS